MLRFVRYYIIFDIFCYVAEWTKCGLTVTNYLFLKSFKRTGSNVKLNKGSFGFSLTFNKINIIFSAEIFTFSCQTISTIDFWLIFFHYESFIIIFHLNALFINSNITKCPQIHLGVTFLRNTTAAKK